MNLLLFYLLQYELNSSYQIKFKKKYKGNILGKAVTVEQLWNLGKDMKIMLSFASVCFVNIKNFDPFRTTKE